MTNIETVYSLILEHPDGLDDDEVCRMTGIEPRQQVHQLCSKLAAQGRIERHSVEKAGKRRKIHNYPRSTDLDRESTKIMANRVSSSHSWERRLAALMAATGLGREQILDEALSDYAMRILANDLQKA